MICEPHCIFGPGPRDNASVSSRSAWADDGALLGWGKQSDEVWQGQLVHFRTAVLLMFFGKTTGAVSPLTTLAVCTFPWHHQILPLSCIYRVNTGPSSGPLGPGSQILGTCWCLCPKYF